MDDRVYFLNVFFEVESAVPAELGTALQDLKRAGNLFYSFDTARKVQGEIKLALAKKL